MARRNRFDPDNEQHVAVRANPAAYTRVARRDAGLRVGAHVEAMRAFYASNTPYPRSVRRLMRDPLKAERRVNRNRARVNRALAYMGVSL